MFEHIYIAKTDKRCAVSAVVTVYLRDASEHIRERLYDLTERHSIHVMFVTREGLFRTILRVHLLVSAESMFSIS
jgi:hypothetical protein